MTRLGVALIAGAAALFGPAAEPGPTADVQASPGLWEMRRVPDGKPLRLCLADVAVLAQVEHRGQTCARKVLRSTGTSEVLRYTCTTGGFGQSKLTMVTPRAVDIETQGISDGLPFNYVVHARRVGDCTSQ
jgi:hypothetical protein